MLDDYFGYHPNLPPDIREMFVWLCQDVADLRTRWDFYLELFSGRDSIKMFMQVAPASFQIIAEALLNDLMARICRLSGPARSIRGQEHFSLKTLAGRLDEAHRPTGLLSDFQQACRPVRALRDQRLGHPDLDTWDASNEVPLPGISRVQMEHIVVLAEGILNFVYGRFDCGQMIFKVYQAGGAEAFLFWLRKAWESGYDKDRSIKTSEV